MLDSKNSLVIMVDIQDRLVASIEESKIVENAEKVLSAAKILEIPIIATEQYPKGLGSTVSVLKEYVNNENIVEKTYFNALQENLFLEKIKSHNKNQIIIFGIETHICVYQTASALVEKGFDVYAIKDACASRNHYEFSEGIDAMRQNGVKISCVEIAIFEWLKGSKHPKFKEIQSLIK